MSKIQRQDIKTEAELATAGAPASSLPGDDQVYVAANSINKTLRQAIIDGDIGGGAGGINYILNGSALANTDGWATYADAAGTRPVDGTGGSPNVTWTRSTSTPMRGAGEFLFTKDAVNRQGQGASYAFSIDRADQAKVQQIEFDWKLVSGTFAGSVTPATDSDLIVYIYDVTNGVLIEPAGRLLEPAITGQIYKYKGTFQTSSNSTSYRLIFHCATTSASAYTLAFDGIRLGPQIVSQGAFVSDWITETLSAGSGFNRFLQWRRVGSDLEGQYKAVMTGAGDPGFIPIPTGLTIDTTKYPNGAGFLNASFGTGHAFDISTSQYYQISVGYNTTTNLYAVHENSTGAAVAGVQATQPFTWAVGDTLSVTYKVPILGWSSTQQLSNDTDTRVVGGLVYTGATQSIPNATWTDVGTGLNATAARQSHNMWDSVNKRWIIPVTGFYQIVIGTGFAISGTGSRANALKIDGSGPITNALFQPSSSDTGLYKQTIDSFFTAGQTVGLMVYQSSGGALNLTAAEFTITRQSGPSQIAASEDVFAFATSNAGQSLANGTATIINFNNIVTDSHGRINTGTNWYYSIPISGVYEIHSLFQYDNVSWNAGTTYYAYIEWTDSAGNIIANYLADDQINQGTQSYFRSNHCHLKIRLTAGQRIRVVGVQTRGSSTNIRANSATNWVAINRVGN